MSTYELIDCKHGRFLYNTNDQYVGASLVRYGEWSEHEVELFAKILRPGDHVIEAGSNIGSHTVPISRLVGETGLVHSFEPMRYTQQLLSANLALNECFNVLGHRAAVGRESASIQFPLPDPRQPANFGAMSVLNRNGHRTEQVQQIALDALELERLDFIKADIEEYEFELLVGARQTIAKFRPVVYLEFGPNKDELVAYFDALDYSCYYFISPMFNPKNFRGETVDHFQASSADLLCVPNERSAVSGLTSASVGDGRVSWTATGIVYATLPWSGAEFS
ncbi:MAG: FkbM family methyltransferase [Comamonadaceae bacterium]|nr:MAG: FkbM family methyltransferase [Comamonadaceae bacterium]